MEGFEYGFGESGFAWIVILAVGGVYKWCVFCEIINTKMRFTRGLHILDGSARISGIWFILIL